MPKTRPTLAEPGIMTSTPRDRSPWLPLCLLCLGLLLPAGCSGISRLVPPSGRLVAEAAGAAGRLRVYTLPPSRTPVLGPNLVVYVELRNNTRYSLRVAYPDLWMGDERKRMVALAPGDVLRPGRLPAGHRRLFASVDPGMLFGRGQGPAEPLRPPEVLSDFTSDGTDLNIWGATSRSSPNGLWIMRNDYNTGTYLSTEGFPFFGLPRQGSTMSLFDILVSTLPDGALLPGATVSGFLFFPPEAKAFAEKGLRWEVHTALSESRVETLTVPLQAVP